MRKIDDTPVDYPIEQPEPFVKPLTGWRLIAAWVAVVIGSYLLFAAVIVGAFKLVSLL